MADDNLAKITRINVPEIIQEMGKSQPGDFIKIRNSDDAVALIDVWNGWEEAKPVPCDILCAGTIPLQDMMLDRGSSVTQVDAGSYAEAHPDCRVVIFEGYKREIDAINQMDEEAYACTGTISWQVQIKKNISVSGTSRFVTTDFMFIVAMIVTKGSDIIELSDPIIYNMQDNTFHVSKDNIAQADTEECISYANSQLSIWYGIQISLLHPQLKTIFQHPRTEVVYDPKARNKKNGKRRCTRYIRVHTIKSNEIAGALYHPNYTRKTLAWYVIGHWRTCRNGKRIFVNGFWKGALRDMHRNLDEGRERKVLPAE